MGVSPDKVVVVTDALIAVLTTVVELQELMTRAQAEGRDVTDEEVRALADANTQKANEIIGRLRG